jgi:DNA helicase-2/ATP-dependent DNA helicase PcrA
MIVARLKHKEFPRHLKCDAYPRQGNPPKVNLVSAIDALLRSAARVEQSGNPQTDWTRVKWALRSSDNSTLASVASAIDCLVAFNRGHRIAANLSEQWIACGVYSEARDAIDSALMQEQILSNSTGPLKGIHVMNMHKCKGKQSTALSSIASSIAHLLFGRAIQRLIRGAASCSM